MRFFPFSFGPFLGFWTAFESATQLGALCIPGGGMSSEARIRTLTDNSVTALCATPTYAIHLGQKAKALGVDASKLALRTIIVAGESGGSLPAVRDTLAQLWPTATVRDHHGMTEVGPVSFENPDHSGVLHIIDSAYLAEVLDVETHEPVTPGGKGELVLTTLQRIACPLLRYRTGDLVRLHEASGNAAALGNAFTALDGGILSRCDDMVLIRGVNVYPSAVDQIVRQVAGIAEYRVTIEQGSALTEMRVEVEPEDAVAGDGVCEALSRALRESLHLRVPVQAVESGALPRFELKAKRWMRS
ncbi:MAG: AMP-binding protein [Rhodospirillales bacterium]|nr:AMP-binding protein [Rhodospirillales bacterium]